MNGWRVFLGRIIPAVAFLVLFVGAVTAHAWDINGTVTNSTTRPGRVFLYLQQQNGGDTGLGVSVPGPATSNTPFTIRGVPNGTYVLKAFVDGSGTGSLHPKDPVWSSTIDITGGNHTLDANSTVTFTSLPTVAPVAPANAQILPGDNGAFVGWDEPQTGNGNNIADSYKVYYSTTSATPKANPAGVITVPGGNNSDFALFHINNGAPLYVQVTALVGGTESAASPVATTPIINPPPGGHTVSGTINLSGISNPTGNLYVAVVDQKGKGGPVAVAYVANPPQLANNFTIHGVPDGTYSLFALIDMNSDGKIGSGDIMISDQQAPVITVNGADLNGRTVTLSKSNASPFLNTSHYQDTNTPPNDGYQVVIGARSQTETVVNLTVTNGPGNNGISYPIDLGVTSWGEFQTWLNVNGNRPQLSDIYTLVVQYANGAVAPDTIPLHVTAVLDSFATPTAPQGYLAYPMPDPVVYSWTSPTSPPNPYTYSFWVSVPGFSNNNDQYSNLPSYTTSQSIPGLSYGDGQQYNWNITVQDAAGNQAQKNVWFTATTQPAITSFLPASAVPGTQVTITGFNFSTTPSNNTVNFGCGASAQATTASATQLQVVVPLNACTGSLQITANGKTSSSSTTPLIILAAATTTSVGANIPTGSTYGTDLVLSANVTSGIAGTITGTVQFKIDGNNFGSPVWLDGSGHAQSSSTTTLSAGAHTFTAVYNGNAAYNISTSPGYPLTINKATATVTLGTLDFTYDKTAKAPTAATNPAGLTVAFNYNGSTVAPTNVGSYGVVATVNDTNYQGTTSGTLTITKGDQTITFNALPTKYLGAPAFNLPATATSGLPVSYVSSDPTVASISGSTVTILTVGTTTITASQAGDANYNPAPPPAGQLLTVNSASKGDVNSDGKVDILDALQTLQYVVGLIAHDPITIAKYVASADVAPLDIATQLPLGEGVIDIQDVQVMLQRSMNLWTW